jgi:hypothetical protein
LNRRRAEVWGAGVDRLRSLVLQALDALGEALASDNRTARIKAAVVTLKLAQLSAPVPAGPTSAEEILASLVAARVRAKQGQRLKHLSDTDRLMASMTSRTEAQAEADEREARAEVLAELEAELNGEVGE